MGHLSGKSRVMDIVTSVVHLWEQRRTIYREWADLHAMNARNHGDHARALQGVRG